MKNLSFKLILGLITLMLFSHDSDAQCTVSITATRDTFCLNSNDTLTGAASSAGGVYTWSIGTLSSPATVGNPEIVSASTQGTYTVTVSWTDGVCTATATHVLTALDVSATLLTITEPSCGRNNGQIQCSVTGSRFNCQFFQFGAVIQAGGATSISNLLPGNYTFVVNELSTGCSDTISNIILTDTTTYPTFDNVAVTPETCFNDKDGTIRVQVGNCTSGCVYAWSQNAGDHSDTAVGLQAGLYTLSVSKGGCSNIDTAIIVPGPSAKLQDSLWVYPDHCHFTDGVGEIRTHGGTGPYTYVWTLDSVNGALQSSTIDTVRGLPGDTTLFVVTIDSHGCKDTMSGRIGASPGPSARITNVDSICDKEHNGVLIVEATSNDGPFTYLWTSGSTSTVAGNLSVGAYAVTVTNSVGCDTILYTAVEAYRSFIYLNAIPGTIYEGQTTELLVQTGVPATNVHWSPYVPGSTGSLDVYDKPMTNTEYTVIVDFGEACQLFDTTHVIVLTDTSKMVVPNTFTPNNDGINDNFMLISYQTTLRSFHIWVYDRWGNKVYESTDVNFAWDGTDIFAANKPLNTAVFAYAIEYTLYNDPEKRELGGNISLVK